MQKLRDLCHRYPQLRDHIPDALLYSEKRQPFTRESLEDYRDDLLAATLTHLHPNLILAEFGRSTLLWSAAHGLGIGADITYLERAAELLGKDLQLLDVAHWSDSHYNHSTRLSTIEKSYDLMLQRPCARKSLDLLLQKHTALPEKQRFRYTIAHVHAPHPEPGFWDHISSASGAAYQFYFDAPIAYVLMRSERPTAVLTCVLENAQSLSIRQLQGIKPKLGEKQLPTRGLPSKYRQLLIDYVRQIAASNDISSISMQSAINNEYVYSRREEAKHAPLFRMLKNYDVIAAKEGGTQRADCNWDLPMERQERTEREVRMVLASHAPRMLYRYMRKRKEYLK